MPDNNSHQRIEITIIHCSVIHCSVIRGSVIRRPVVPSSVVPASIAPSSIVPSSVVLSSVVAFSRHPSFHHPLLTLPITSSYYTFLLHLPGCRPASIARREEPPHMSPEPFRSKSGLKSVRRADVRPVTVARYKSRPPSCPTSPL